MTHQIWQRYMLEAENALGAGALGTAICLYQQALAEVYELSDGELDELASMRVATCHRLADFWRAMEEPAYELRYLKLASELVTALVPQCPNQGANPHQRTGLLSGGAALFPQAPPQSRHRPFDPVAGSGAGLRADRPFSPQLRIIYGL